METKREKQTVEQLQAQETAVKQAVKALQIARKHLCVFARERATKQLSNSAISAIGQNLQSIERRIAAYDKN